jgi:hypothetical protein
MLNPFSITSTLAAPPAVELHTDAVKDKISVLLEIRSIKDINKPGRVVIWTPYGKTANQIAPIDTARREPNSTEKPSLQDLSKSRLSYTHTDLKVTTNDGKSIEIADRFRFIFAFHQIC